MEDLPTKSNKLVTISRLDSLPLLTRLTNPFFYLFLIHPFLLVELGCPPRLFPPPDKLQRRHVIPKYLLLPPERLSQVRAQRDQRTPHRAVCDDLVVVCAKDEEQNSGHERDVPILAREISKQLGQKQ